MKSVLALLAAALAMAIALPAAAAGDDKAGGSGRWNITGPMWYETKCGLWGFGPGAEDLSGGWVQPCSINVPRVKCGNLDFSYQCPSYFNAPKAAKEEQQAPKPGEASTGR